MANALKTTTSKVIFLSTKLIKGNFGVSNINQDKKFPQSNPPAHKENILVKQIKE